MKRFFVFAWLALPLSAVSLWSGCNPERCEADRPLVELHITLQGVDSSRIAYFELESVVTANPATGSAHPYHERRVGTLPWTTLWNVAGVQLVVDPGGFARRLKDRPESQRHFRLELTLRAYGGSPPRLLAQGRYAKDLDADRCYLDQRLVVSAQTTCDGARDGDPCVGASDEPAVCICDDSSLGCGEETSAGLVCRASTCGDGYTDRANGELCEPGQGSTTCDPMTCLPAPVDAPVVDARDASHLAPCPTLTNAIAGDTVTWGLHELAYPIDANTIRPTLSMLVADVDGDGADEMVLGLPEGYPAGDPLRRGKVYLRDWPLMGNIMLGDPRRTYATLLGGPSVRPYWLGASLAAGDFDGDGVQDLVVGAPLREEGAGAAFVVFGGSGRTLSPALPAPFELSFDTAADQGEYMALEGTPASAPGNSPDLLGYQVHAGDLDGDGVEDLVIAAPGTTRDASAAGAVYILPGGQSMWEPRTMTVASLPVLTLRTAVPSAKLGAALATGDVDGDGVTDLVVGSEAPPGAASSPGGVYVVYGRANLLTDLPRTLWVSGADAAPAVEVSVLAPEDGTSPILGVGGQVAVCDLDRDGAGELVATVGRVGSAVSPHAVLVVQGSAMSRLRQGGSALELDTDAVQIRGDGADLLGAALHCGDANGDGHPDLLMGAPGHDLLLAGGGLLTDSGAVYVLLGTTRADYWGFTEVSLPVLFSSPETPSPFPLVRLYGDQEGGFFGGALATSSHLGLADLTQRSAFTYVAAPGWSDAPGAADRANMGRVWGLFIPALLPCGFHTSCPVGTP